jgi:hypothetical protein
MPDSEALRLGVALGELALAGRNKSTFVVAPGMDAFGLWVEQLIAESTGKAGLGILPVVGEPLGTPKRYGDDRLFVQLRMEGDPAGEQDSVIGALVNEGHPAITLDLGDSYDLGREFFRWEFATAVVGVVLGINPFDEPNVQESKDNTARVLGDFEAGKALTLDGVDAEVSKDAVARLLDHVRDNDYVAIAAYIGETDQSEAVFRAIRADIRDALGAATTLGYGPRFLHSTGQLHKGGPAQGVFLQVTADAQRAQRAGHDGDIRIPGKSYTFGQLKAAQAIGDVQSLEARARPVLRVRLGADVHAGLARLRESVQAATHALVASGR